MTFWQKPAGGAAWVGYPMFTDSTSNDPSDRTRSVSFILP